MAGQIPASVLSRALRSRAVRPQFAIAGAQRLVRTTSFQVQRSFSSEPPTDESIPLENRQENEHETSPQSQSVLSLRDGENTDRRESKSLGKKGNNHKQKIDEEAMMNIASATVTDGATFTSKSIAMEMKWMVDPRDLADRVGRLLRADDVAQAAALTREAQRRQMKCDSAWNHLMRYAMDKGYADAAFKFYNDMKKRGRMPNAKTYTIMLQGFSKQPQSRHWVKKAESVYRSIFSKQSTTKPNVIHSNAMLGVCQRHGDMDSLWRIAGEMPDEGPEKPDQRTYSIILAALQHAARNDIQKMDRSKIDEIVARQEKMVIEGKRIWADVVYQWKENEMALNNQVVNSMAYLLLDGVHDSDFYDVFSLYNQTMGIPILAKKPIPNINAARRRAEFKLTTDFRAQQQISEMDGPTKSASKGEDVPFVDEHNRPIQPESENKDSEAETSMEEEETEEEEDFGLLFEPVVTEAEDSPPLKPDNKDLTMILSACLNMTQGSGHGPSYWNLLTKESDTLRIDPDEVSSMSYIRLLRQTRSSKIVVQTIREQLLPLRLVGSKTLHVAFAACRRDRRNKHILLIMRELFDLMPKARILPDPRVLYGYLDFIQTLSEDPHSLLHMQGLGQTPKNQSLQALGKQLLTNLRLFALTTLRPHVKQLHEAIEQGRFTPRTRWDALKVGNNSVSGEDSNRILARVRTLIDETLKPEYAQLVPKAERKTLIAESKMLKTYSDKATIKNLRHKIIYPTRAQWEAFDKQQMEFTEEPSKPNQNKEKGDKLDQFLEPSQQLNAETAAKTEPVIQKED